VLGLPSYRDFISTGLAVYWCWCAVCQGGVTLCRRPPHVGHRGRVSDMCDGVDAVSAQVGAPLYCGRVRPDHVRDVLHDGEEGVCAAFRPAWLLQRIGLDGAPRPVRVRAQPGL
jgi:hypothetical protein